MSDDDVGYKSPPKNTQFKKGKSGNPTGRPRVRKPQVMPIVGTDPEFSRETLRTEAARKIAIKDGKRTIKLSASKVTQRAMFNKAMQGSVYAQREVLHQLEAAETRHMEERKREYDGWKEYVEIIRKERALTKMPDGEPDRRYPVLADIDFNPLTYVVSLTGALSEEEHVAMLRIQDIADLAYEASHFFKEEIDDAVKSFSEVRMGPFMAIYTLYARESLKCYRTEPAALETKVRKAALKSRLDWRADLKKRGKGTCLESLIETNSKKARNFKISFQTVKEIQALIPKYARYFA